MEVIIGAFTIAFSGTVIVAILGYLIDRSAARHERTETGQL